MGFCPQKNSIITKTSMGFNKLNRFVLLLTLVTTGATSSQSCKLLKLSNILNGCTVNANPPLAFVPRSSKTCCPYEDYLNIRGGGDVSENGDPAIFSRLLKIIQKANPLKLNKVQENYISSLEEQIEILERLIRTSREESRQLRNLLKSKSSSSLKNSSDAIRQGVLTESHLRDELESMKIQIKELETTKKELITLLENEKKQMEILNKKLELEQQKVQATQERAKSELEELRRTLLEQSKKQLEQLQKSAEERLQAEKKRLKKLANDAIDAERKKGEAAVEKEKNKMRKLVKVLAEKERKEMLKAEKKSKKNSNSKIIQGNGGSGIFAGRRKAVGANVRGSGK